MLRNLFSNRLFLGALAFFVLCIVGSLLYMQHVDRQGAEQLAKTEEHVKQWNERQNAQLTTAVADGEDSASGDVHVDGDARKSAGNPQDSPPTSRGDTTVPQLSEAEMERLLAENRAQQAKIRADYIAEWGEPPSLDASYQHFRDNHGNVLRHYEGTAVVSHYEIKFGFAPTPDEFARYKQLRADLRAAQFEDERNGGSAANPSAEVQRLETDLQTLVESAQREYPWPYGIGYYGANNSGFPSEVAEKSLNEAAYREFYRRMGVEHLYEVHHKLIQTYQGE